MAGTDKCCTAPTPTVPCPVLISAMLMWYLLQDCYAMSGTKACCLVPGEGGELATHYKSSGDDPDVT
eukprot:1866260-Rhodomonas_salina.1